jgi:hypothetical protein
MSVIRITKLELRQMFEAWKGWTLGGNDIVEIEGFVKVNTPGHSKTSTKDNVLPRKVVTDKEGFVLSDEPSDDCMPRSGEYYDLVFKKAREKALKNKEIHEIKVSKRKRKFISHEEYINNIKDVMTDGGSKTVCIEEGVNKETFRQRYITAAKKIGCQNDIKFSIKGNTITIMKTEKEVLQ